VTALAFSPDGTRIISGSIDHLLKIWNAKTGAEVEYLLEGVGVTLVLCEGVRGVMGSLRCG